MESPDVYIEKAKEEASNYGKIIGMVTRVEEISHGEDKRVIRAEIPYETYLNEDIKVGQYLGVVSAVKRNVFLTRVIEVMRADIVSSTHLPAVRVIEEPASITTPLSVKLELLAEIGKSGVIPPVSPVDPQSPLILPSKDFLIKTLGLPKPEVKVGRILDGGEPSEVEIGFDWDLLNHHLLVIGTTGSGKTNFLRVLHTRSPWGSIVFDIQGDYFVPTALEGGRIVVPLTRVYDNKPIVDLIKMITKRSGLVDAQIDHIDGQEFQITAKYKEKDVHFTLELATVNLKRSYKEISDSSPIMTEQAAAFFNMGVEQENLSSLDAWKKGGEEFLKNKNVAYPTINNLMRSIYLLDDMGILDIIIRGKSQNIYLEEPNYASMLFDKTCIDLRLVAEKGRLAFETVAYVYVSKLFSIKDEKYKENEDTGKTVLIFDEAHEFFPQGTAETSTSLERIINRVMRLGRVRGFGTVMATHRPEDLNPLVVTLSNSRVSFRADEDALRKVEMEDHSNFLSVSPPGWGVIRSYVIRGRDLAFVTDLYNYNIKQ